MKRTYIKVLVSCFIIIVLCSKFIKGFGALNVVQIQNKPARKPGVYSSLPNKKILKDSFIKYEYLKAVNRNANAGTYLNIKTYDGSDQPVHPDIIYFENKFRNHKYWMAYTPYPDSDEKYENPCIAVSDDGFNWESPDNIKNPIVHPPNDLMYRGHYSDTDIISDDGRLEVYFVYNKDGVVGPSKFLRVMSEDGVNWSKPELIYQTAADTAGYSPAVIKENNGYKMWYISNGNRMFLVTGKDSKSWDTAQKCSLKISGWTLWHVNVIKSDLGYEGLLCAINNSILNKALFYIKSSDGLNWTYNTLPIIYPSNSGWDSMDIYRSAMIKQDGLYRIWYSAKGTGEKWHIGYTEGRTIESLKGYKRD